MIVARIPKTYSDVEELELELDASCSEGARRFKSAVARVERDTINDLAWADFWERRSEHEKVGAMLMLCSVLTRCALLSGLVDTYIYFGAKKCINSCRKTW